MLKEIKQAICFLDLEKRMAGLCADEIKITQEQADFILAKIRILN